MEMRYNTAIAQGGYAPPATQALAGKKGPNLSEMFLNPYQKARATSNPTALASAQRQSDDAYRSSQWAGIRGLERQHAQTNADLEFNQAQAASQNAMNYFNGLRGFMYQQPQQQNNPLMPYIMSTLFSGGF